MTRNTLGSANPYYYLKPGDRVFYQGCVCTVVTIGLTVTVLRYTGETFTVPTAELGAKYTGGYK